MSDPGFTVIYHPTCPVCGCPPRLVTATQAFCAADDCPVLMWNPLASDGGLSHVQLVDLSWLED